MKTKEELYKEVMDSSTIQEELSEAQKNSASLESFLKKYDCNASVDAFKAFLKEKASSKLGDDSVESVAGGYVMYEQGSGYNIYDDDTDQLLGKCSGSYKDAQKMAENLGTSDDYCGEIF